MNKKHIFSILECPDGYVIADDVFSKYGSIVVCKNTIVNEYIRQKLINFKVDRVAVYKPTLPKNSVDNPKAAFIATKRKYLKGINSVKAIINDLAAGRELDYEKINQLSCSVYRIQKQAGYDEEDLSTIRTLTTKIK